MLAEREAGEGETLLACAGEGVSKVSSSSLAAPSFSSTTGGGGRPLAAASCKALSLALLLRAHLLFDSSVLCLLSVSSLGRFSSPSHRVRRG